MRIDLNDDEAHWLRCCLREAIGENPSDQPISDNLKNILNRLESYTMQIAENLAHQLIAYLAGQPDSMAKMLRDQVKYCLELHQEAFHHLESRGVYRVQPTATCE